MTDNFNRTYNESKVRSMMQPNSEPDFMEETAAEIAEPIRVERRDDDDIDAEKANGNGIGWLALALSIVSLFIMPVIMGAAGIILGFIARRRGAETLGAWSIGIGVVSIIIAIFVLPFYR